MTPKEFFILEFRSAYVNTEVVPILVYYASVRYVFFILVRFFLKRANDYFCVEQEKKKNVRAKKIFFEVCPIGRKILTRQPLQDESS